MRLFERSIKVEHPTVIIPKVKLGGKDYVTVKLKGKFRRVLTLTSKEHDAIRLMELHVDRFAPASSVKEDSGNGVLITESAFRNFQ